MGLGTKLGATITASTGEKKASLVLKNAHVVNLFTNEIETLDVAVEDNYIVGLGSYDGEQEVDLTGKFVLPGFIDGHIHLESSMVTPAQFENAVLPHGTTCVVTDPHEIANVAGVQGIQYMLQTTENLALDVFFMLPSCVPATPLDESGAELSAKDLTEFFNHKRVLGLAELMNSYGTLKADPDILNKIKSTLKSKKMIDGHAPFLSGKDLNAYVAAGVRSDHECSTFEEAMEKLRRGQWIMIREGTAAKNLDALMPLFQAPFYNRAMLVTDDKHPGDLIKDGHIDYIIARAVQSGADPINAIKMATLNPATYFGLRTRGAVAPGFKADIVVVDNLKEFHVLQVYKEGVLVAENGQSKVKQTVDNDFSAEIKTRVFDSFHMQKVTNQDFALPETCQNQRVIQLTPHELLTSEKIVPYRHHKNLGGGVDLQEDIVKVAVFERHKNTHHTGLGFLGGYGLKKGAVASSVGHDSHNLIVAGVNDLDMQIAANCVLENSGGLAIACDGKIIDCLPLPIAGIMSDKNAQWVDKKLEQMKNTVSQMGISPDIDAFMTLAFVSLPVIPSIRINTYGIIDVATQQVVQPVF